MGEDRTDAHSGGRGADRLTIAEAAALLGVHKNTVRNRIKNGTYRAEMVQTERGPTYLIDRDSLLTNLTTNTLSSASQELVGPQAMQFVQELLRPFVSELGEVREELGAERARRQIAEVRAEALEAELEALREPRESPQKVEETSDRTEESHSATGGAQEGTERQQWRSGWLAPLDKLPWWHYLWGLFLVFLIAYFTGTAVTSIRFGDYGWSEFFSYSRWSTPVYLSILAAGAWLPAGLFGVWAGVKQRDPLLRSRIIPLGALVGVVTELGTVVARIQLSLQTDWVPSSFPSLLLLRRQLLFLALPAWLVYVSGALIGNAWQRRRIGRISGTTPASPVSRTSQGAAQQPRKDWTPRKQAILGFSGTIISALITLFGTIITVRSGGP